MNFCQAIATFILAATLCTTFTNCSNRNNGKNSSDAIHKETEQISNVDVKIGDFIIPNGKLCSAVEDLIGHSSVVEFGAKSGQNGRCWLRSFDNLLNTNIETYKVYYKQFLNEMKISNLLSKQQVICSWEGYEIAPNIQHVTQGWVKYFNPNKKFNVGKTFDWVVSFGMDENVPCGIEHIYIDNLISHAKEGLIFSLVEESQMKGSLQECLIRTSFLVEKLEKENWRRDKASEKVLTEKIKDEYWEQNLLIFRKIKDISR